MAKMTIAQLREKEVEKLYKMNESLGYENAKKVMSSFYRFCGLEEVLLYRENDSRLHDAPYTKELQKKSDLWLARLKKYFEPYGLTLTYYGYLPTIVRERGESDAIYRYFYN